MGPGLVAFTASATNPEDRRTQSKDRTGDGQVEHTLEHPRWSAQRRSANSIQHDSSDVVGIGSLGGDAAVEEARHYVHLDVVLQRAAKCLDQACITGWAEGDNHAPHVVPIDDAVELVDFAEHR